MTLIPYYLRTPIGIALATTHWIVIAYAMLGDHAGSSSPTLLTYYLVILNAPAIILANLIAQPVIYFFNTRQDLTFWTIGALSITLQWLTVGGLIQLYVSKRRSDSGPDTGPLWEKTSDQPEKIPQSF